MKKKKKKKEKKDDLYGDNPKDTGQKLDLQGYCLLQFKCIWNTVNLGESCPQNSKDVSNERERKDKAEKVRRELCWRKYINANKKGKK